ncbi:uncharacterized protein [Eucyclogobius newberryi]|uniref:uncharacterized protein n=1 Tax=Eucyclogobius newberryi TaxID=166745 RepID=UPI003B5CA70D
MNFVRLLFINIVIFLGGFWAVKVEALLFSAEEGNELVIQCSHTNAHGNMKYFCKKPCTDDRHVLIWSQPRNPNSRYRIRDSGNSFSVTITDLTMDDSGEYWCGIQRVGIDTYNYVLITVTPRAEMKDSPPDASAQNRTSTAFVFAEKLLYTGGALAALLVILLIAVVIFSKRRHRDIKKPTAGETMTLTDTQDTPTFCSANQSRDPGPSTAHHHGIILEPTSDIYASVQRDGESYSSVFFTKHRASVARADPESTVYSQVICH